MSVLVKGMKMPSTCSKCPMCREDDLGVVYSYCTGKLEMIDGFGLNGRMDFCPLVEVPTPHGRLIDADALRDKLQKEIDKGIPPFNDVIGSIRCGVRLARNIVEDEPTIDEVPVRHGRWIPKMIIIGGCDHFFGMKCSVCGEDALNAEGVDFLTDFCPSCGAKMDA